MYRRKKEAVCTVSFFAKGHRLYWYTHTQIHITSKGFLFFIAKLILK